jgi:hypothetical protein
MSSNATPMARKLNGDPDPVAKILFEVPVNFNLS